MSLKITQEQIDRLIEKHPSEELYDYLDIAAKSSMNYIIDQVATMMLNFITTFMPFGF
jgi:hypothetical protein